MNRAVLSTVLASFVVFAPGHDARQTGAASRGCNTWTNPTTVDICNDSSTVYATQAAAENAPPASYEDVASEQPGSYSTSFTCNKICPPGEVPGCQKANKYEGFTSGPTVSAVAVPGGFKSRTCYIGATRTEGCRRCIPIEV